MGKQSEVRERTRQKFIDAFLELSGQKDINQISVGELVKVAGYNRSTFYEYFSDMPDLIHQIEDHFIDEIELGVTEILQNTAPGDDRISVILKLMVDLNEPLYTLLGPHGDPAFPSRVKDTVFPMMSKLIGISDNGPFSGYIDYIGAYAESALFGFLQYWHEQGRNLSEEELFSLGYNLVMYGIIGTLNREKLSPT